MATVMEPRNPVLLAPFVVAQWLNTYLSLAVAIVMITEHKHIEIWGYIGLVMQLIFALLGLRNGLFVMFHTVHPGAGEDDLEEQLECASHLYLTGTFGIASLAGPYYLEFLAWRALKFRMHKNYMFYYIIELLLVDILFAPLLFIALSKGATKLFLLKAAFIFISVSWGITKIVIRKFCVWCPKVRIHPEKGEEPDNPTIRFY